METSAEPLDARIEVAERARKLGHCLWEWDECIEVLEADEVGWARLSAEDAGQRVEVMVVVVVARPSDAAAGRNVVQNKEHSC